jgi:dihydrofolate reductase
VADAVATGLVAADGKNLEVLGTDVTVQCLARGLIDEIDVHVLPVLLGAGVPLYATEATAMVNLELLGSSSSEGITNLRYRVRRSVTRSHSG